MEIIPDNRLVAGARALASQLGMSTDISDDHGIDVFDIRGNVERHITLDQLRTAAGQGADEERLLRVHENYLARLRHDNAHAAAYLSTGELNTRTELCDDDCEYLVDDPDDAMDIMNQSLLELVVLTDNDRMHTHVRLLHGFGGPNNQLTKDFSGVVATSDWAFSTIETPMYDSMDALIEFFVPDYF